MTVACPVEWLLLLHAATTLFMVGVIWFVQVFAMPESRHRCRLPMTTSTLTLALLSAVMLFSPLSAGADPDPLSQYRWTHRLLVLDVPDTEPGRATLATFRTSLGDRMEEVLARDLLIVPVGDLPHPGDLLQPAAALGATERSGVRRRLGLQGRGAQLVLIGKDGGIKARQSEGVFDLERLFALIDSMPMRRAEMGQR
jgi:hypothetical protein